MLEHVYFIGLDNGGTSVKAAVYDLEGNEIAVGRTKVTQINPHDGWIERDIDQVWQANCTAVRKAIEESKIDPSDIKGVAITGYGNGGFFLKDDLTPSYPNCILSGDMRAKDVVKQLIQDGVQQQIIDKTNQTLWAGQPTALMAWMKQNCPEQMKETSYVMSCVDYLRMKLTGNIAGEISNMSGISAMNLYTKKFEKDILDKLGIGDYYKCLPEKILGSAEIGGYVTEESSALTGIPAGVPVMGGLFDVTSCALACGLTNSEYLCVILGTWSINEYLSKKPIADENFFMTSLYSIDNYYLTIEGSTTSASNLQWFVDNFMHEEEIEMKKQGKDVYDECERLLESVPYDDSSILFFPFLYGTNVNLDSKAAFIGINGRHTKAHMLRAVYEGIVFSHMYHIEKLFKYKKDKTSAIRISGGGSGSAQWIQMFADALQIPVEVPDAKELGAMGAAICASIGSGYYNSFEEATKHFCRIKKRYDPIASRAGYYKKKYSIYKDVLKAMNPVWNEWKVIEK